MQCLEGKDIPTEESTSVWLKSTEIHKKSFETLVSYLEEIVFAKKRNLSANRYKLFLSSSAN